jgi:serine/threonine-protein kinase
LFKRTDAPFEIIEILGEGSFGTVCIARMTDDPSRRLMAIKVLKGAFVGNQKILNRTRDEARLLARLDHPNIVRVARLVEVDLRPIVVMELVRGVSLRHLVAQFRGGIPGSVAIEVVRQTCVALHHAYDAHESRSGNTMRVIHRDIKPSNILISLKGEVKVVDFGIAKGDFAGREARTESVVMGSRPYMAPERLDGVADSPAVDVYSAGMTLFELLTGHTMGLSINPVPHARTLDRELRFLSVDDLSPASVDELRDLIRAMCAYDRENRPMANEVARRLKAISLGIRADRRVPLQQFAEAVVTSVYESRPRVRIEDADFEGEDGSFIRRLCGRPSPRGPLTDAYAPHVFIGMVALLLAVLGAATMTKAIARHGGAAPHSGVQIKIWLPGDATVQIQDRILCRREPSSFPRAPPSSW